MPNLRKLFLMGMVAAASPFLVPTGANADGTSFTAEATQSHPKGGVQRGQLFVSDAGVRFEARQSGQHVIQIVLPKENVTRILFPADKSYLEMPGAMPIPTDRPDTPCPEKAACEKLSDEKLGKVDTEKWTVTLDGAPGAITLWWDKARKMSLRQEFFDGRVTQMTLKGSEDYEGRAVERWETDFIMPSGQRQKSVQLYDPKLAVAVKEVHPNGMTRMLRDVKEVKTDPKWFVVPEGFKKVKPMQTQPQSQTK